MYFLVLVKKILDTDTSDKYHFSVRDLKAAEMHSVGKYKKDPHLQINPIQIQPLAMFPEW
jgi:hypothetical protein